MTKSRALLIQQAYRDATGVYPVIMSWLYPRNLEYCRRHEIEYMAVYGNAVEEWPPIYGAWAKVALILNALEAGYKHVIWLDLDTLIVDLDADLRDGCPAEGLGMTTHQPDGMPVLNCGALYVTNSEDTKKLFREWISWYPGPINGWHEQAMINLLGQVPICAPLIVSIDDKWNSTRAANNRVEHPVVEGFHGEGAAERRFQLMKEFLNAQHP